MEKPALTSDDTAVDAADAERGVGRGRNIQYAPDVDGRRTSIARSMSRRGSMDSLSIRQARRSVDPSLALPPQYRTMYAIPCSKVREQS